MHYSNRNVPTLPNIQLNSKLLTLHNKTNIQYCNLFQKFIPKIHNNLFQKFDTNTYFPLQLTYLDNPKKKFHSS